ncbi:unnamed protein product [Arabis nemorensis]|uniref:DUF1985 domain-containing protein n=1 Tax=Arabis nemorensis TaxID=586526 RepID=A0A565CCD8_9BRAS|nr:unnamed protein product [Arabis nemorensis]
MEDDEKQCLGLVVLVEGILIGVSSTEKIPYYRLKYASDFDQYYCQPWGKDVFAIISSCVSKMGPETWTKERYNVKGFVLAVHL